MTGAISEQGNHSVVGGDDELESIGKKLGFQNGIRDGVGRAAVKLFLEDFEDDALGHVPDYELALVVPGDEDISEGRVGLDQENVRVHFDFAVVFVDLKNYIKKKKRPNPKIKIYQLNRFKQKKNLSFKFNNWKIALLLDIKKPIIVINILKTFRIKKIMGLIFEQFKSIFSITNPLFQFSKLHNKKLKISFELPKKSDEIILANYLTFVQNLNQFFIRVSKTKHLKARILQATEEIKDPNLQNQNEIESTENKNNTQNGNDKNTKDNQNPSTDEKKEETNNLNTKTDEASDHTSNDDEHYITLKIHKMNFLIAVCCIMGIIILIMIFVCCCCFCCKKNESTNQNRSMSMTSINQTEEQKYRVPQPRAKAFSQNSNYVPNSVNQINNHRIEYTAQNKRKIQSEMVNHLNDSSLSSSFDRNSDDMDNRPADGTRKSKKKKKK